MYYPLNLYNISDSPVFFFILKRYNDILMTRMKMYQKKLIKGCIEQAKKRFVLKSRKIINIKNVEIKKTFNQNVYMQYSIIC